jgi:hypothetical protein
LVGSLVESTLKVNVRRIDVTKRMIMSVTSENVKALEKVREVMIVEEGKEISLNDALKRILEKYRALVPYM